MSFLSLFGRPHRGRGGGAPAIVADATAPEPMSVEPVFEPLPQPQFGAPRPPGRAAGQPETVGDPKTQDVLRGFNIRQDVAFATPPAFDPHEARRWGPFSYNPNAGHQNKLELISAMLQDLSDGLQGRAPAALDALRAQDRDDADAARWRDHALRLQLTPRQLLALHIDPSGWARGVNLNGDGVLTPGDQTLAPIAGPPHAGPATGGVERLQPPDIPWSPRGAHRHRR